MINLKWSKYPFLTELHYVVSILVTGGGATWWVFQLSVFLQLLSLITIRDYSYTYNTMPMEICDKMVVVVCPNSLQKL